MFGRENRFHRFADNALGKRHARVHVAFHGPDRHRRGRGVLLLGLINMMRGGSPNTSQRLMRLRVLLQFVAIIVIMATIWIMERR